MLPFHLHRQWSEYEVVFGIFRTFYHKVVVDEFHEGLLEQVDLFSRHIWHDFRKVDIL